MIKKTGIGILLFCLAGAASAKCETFFGLSICFPTDDDHSHIERPRTVNAPEIDPASAAAGLTLMVGGLAVLRGRRTKNTQS